MKRYDYKDGVKVERYKHREMWIERSFGTAKRVWSYDTYIGYIDKTAREFITNAYGRYSSTTSKQITMLCNEMKLTRVDIDKR